MAKGTGPGSGITFEYALQTQSAVTGINNVNLPYNVGGFTMQRDRWYHVELYQKLNQPGGDDGVVKMWLYEEGRSPVLVMHYDKNTGNPNNSKGIWHGRKPGEIIGSDYSPNWTKLKYSGIWGGKGGSIPADQWIRIDHYYATVN